MIFGRVHGLCYNHNHHGRLETSATSERGIAMAIGEGTTAEMTTLGLPVARARMTEEQFVEWCKPKLRAEWVDGEVTVMSPASHRHNNLSNWLNAIVRFFVERHDLGEVSGPQMQVRLSALRTRREPDLLFLEKAHLDRLRSNHIEGPPDLIVEIVSPESQARDWRDKYLEYEAAGVREYLVVDPNAQVAELYRHGDAGEYQQIAEVDGCLRFATLPGFFLRTDWLWSEPLPKLTTVLNEFREIS